MKLQTLDISNGIKYRGEGNANLVVALVSTNTILRFPKSKFREKCQSEKLEALANYVNQMLVPELPGLVDPVLVVQLDWQQFQTVRSAVSGFRPQTRLNKDIYYPAALLLPDYALCPPPGLNPPTNSQILAVELKPKLGYIPYDSKQARICNFCLKQFYKVSSGQVKRPSQYCPLDLFSGDRSRMMTAVAGMLDSPQNNIRIFRNGQIMHDESSVSNKICRSFLSNFLGGVDFLPSLLTTALTHDNGSQRESIAQEKLTVSYTNDDKQTCCTKSTLSPCCVLGSILKLQKRSQISDETAEDTLEELLANGWDLSTLQTLVSCAGSSGEPQGVALLRDYLLAVTAKDLSIILTVIESTFNQKQINTIKLGAKYFAFKWSVVDLDPKNLNSIPKYVEQKKHWMEAYNQSQCRK